MSLITTFMYKIGQIILSILRVLRKALCCRRKKEPEYLLPMTVGHVINMENITGSEFENSEFKSHWETWPDSGTNVSLTNGTHGVNHEIASQTAATDDPGQEDFFKDMVPQIRKPKKVFIKNDVKESEMEISSNRLAMDPKAILMDSELGIIDDNPSNWEDSENLDALWDTDMLLREKKLAEQEQRRAEHQRRKMEKENRRSSKPESLSSMMLSLSDSKTKHS